MPCVRILAQETSQEMEDLLRGEETDKRKSEAGLSLFRTKKMSLDTDFYYGLRE